ncbi:hypothetical protein ACWF0M_18960 [Kribbella sp. NPDC055110]
MGGWESLRVDLQRLQAESPGALVVRPNPETVRRSEARFHIVLAAWATDIAAELHSKYGDLVDLQVGAIRFPTRELLVNPHSVQLRGEPAEDAGVGVEALTPLSVRTGWHAIRDVLVTNRTDRAEVLITNGQLSSAVIDSSGAVVGRFTGPHNARRVGFEIAPHETRTVPVLIGTASMVPDLGYAVPPGRWTLVAVLQTETGTILQAPLDITITP